MVDTDVTKKIVGCRILLFATVTMILFCPFLYMILYKNIISKKEQSLKHITAQRTLEMHNFLKETEKSISTIFNQKEIISIIDIILRPTQQNEPTAKKNLFQLFSIALKSYKNILDYKNCIIFSPQGSIVFTDNPVYELLSLQEPKLKDSALGKSVAQVLMTLTTDIAEFSYDPYLNTPALFITVPFFKDKQLYAIIAVQLNENNLYSIINNYIGLGATGELDIAKQIPSGILYLDKIRNDLIPPFKKFLPTSYGSELHPIQQATLGYTGSAKIVDSKNILSIASWQYVPRFNFGIVAKTSYNEVVEPLSYYTGIVCLLLLCFFVLCCIHGIYDPKLYDYIKSKIFFISNYKSSSNYVLNGIWLISCIVLIFSLYYFYALHKNMRREEETSIAKKTAVIQQKIDHILHTTQLITQSIAYDLKFNRLEKDNLIKRLESEIHENPFISGISVAYAPYAYESNKKLFGRYVNRTAIGTEVFNLDEIYDYTSETIANASFRIFYLDALKKNGVLWLDPTIENLSKKFAAACSEDFYTTHNPIDKSVGVVTVFIDMQTIANIIESIAVNTASPSYLLSSNGRFIYHPNFDYKHAKKTIIDMAELNASPDLITLWKNKQKNVYKFLSFYDASIKKTKLAFFMPIAKANWFISLFFAEKVFLPSTIQLRHYYMIILFCLTFFIICSLMVFSKLYKRMNERYLSSCYTLLIPLMICFTLLLYISYKYQTFQDGNQIPLTDKVQLDQFLTEKKEVAKIIHEKSLISIPTGIEVNSLEFEGAQAIKVSGLIWQKYDDIQHKGIEPDVYFKEASGKVEFTKKYETHIGTTRIIGWNFFIHIPFYMREKFYPLDANQISLVIEHPNLNKNILLVPDLAGYETMSPSSLPGIMNNFKLLGFEVQESFFNFETAKIKSTRGAESFDQSTSYISLRFHIIIVRTMMYAILVFFLPIFIIMFAIYAFFIMGEKMNLGAEHMLTAYTGFLLTIIFLHRSLRDQTATGTIMYIEYFFFLTYFMIFVLILNILLEFIDLRTRHLGTTFKLFYKNFFWELQILMSIIITTIIFY